MINRLHTAHVSERKLHSTASTPTDNNVQRRMRCFVAAAAAVAAAVAAVAAAAAPAAAAAAAAPRPVPRFRKFDPS